MFQILPPFDADIGHYALAILAFTMVYVIRCSYFYDVSVGAVEHALRNSACCGSSCFVMLHVPLAFILLLLSCSLKIIFYHYTKEHHSVDLSEAYLFTISLSFTYLLIVCLRLSHPITHDLKALGLRCIVVFIFPILPPFVDDAITLVTLSTTICIIECAFDRYIQGNRPLH